MCTEGIAPSCAPRELRAAHEFAKLQLIEHARLTGRVEAEEEDARRAGEAEHAVVDLGEGFVLSRVNYQSDEARRVADGRWRTAAGLLRSLRGARGGPFLRQCWEARLKC